MLRICAADIPPQHGTKRDPHFVGAFPEPTSQKAGFAGTLPNFTRETRGVSDQSQKKEGGGLGGREFNRGLGAENEALG